MKKTVFRHIVCILAFAMIVCSNMKVFAHESYSIVSFNNKEYVVKPTGELCLYYDHNGYQISAEKAIELLNQYEENYSQDILYIEGFKNINNHTGVIYPYQNEVIYQKQSQIYLGERLKLTADVLGPMTIHTIESISISDEFSHPYSEKAIIQSIEDSLHIEWNYNSHNNIIDINVSVPEDKIGTVYFIPYYTTYHCIYYNYDGKPSHMYAKTVLEIDNGYAQGIYEVVLQ